DLALLLRQPNPGRTPWITIEMTQNRRRGRTRRCYLLVDEAFADFAPANALLGRTRNSRLLILRSSDQVLRYVRLRLGFIEPPAACTAVCWPTRSRGASTAWPQPPPAPPWPTPIPPKEPQLYGHRATLAGQPAGRAARLESLPAANYLLLETPRTRNWVDDLLQGSTVRHCANFRGLNKTDSRRRPHQRRKPAPACRPGADRPITPRRPQQKRSFPAHPVQALASRGDIR
ncbi:MAG: hypothetical protein U5J62_06230, partial [Desulfurivibrio sp.]|nr:hypothetical protein [Desulfurivibrio sp.]